MKKLAIIVLVALSTANCKSQVPNLQNKAEIKKSLGHAATPPEREKTLKALGVDIDVAEEYADKSLSDNYPILNMSWNDLRGDETPTAMLFLPCTHTGSFLFILQRGPQQWSVTDKQFFDCHYDDNVFPEITNIRSQRTDEILVHNACEGRGTGYVEHHFHLLLIKSGKLKGVFEGVDKLTSYPLPDIGHGIEQNSAVISVPTNNAHQNLEQTRQTIFENGKKTVSRRYIYWSISKNKFIATKFTKVTGPN